MKTGVSKYGTSKGELDAFRSRLLRGSVRLTPFSRLLLSVITVGHSLGASIAEREYSGSFFPRSKKQRRRRTRAHVQFPLLLTIFPVDALYLKLQIPSLSVSARLFGLPRTGNPAFGPWALRVVRPLGIKSQCSLLRTDHSVSDSTGSRLHSHHQQERCVLSFFQPNLSSVRI